MKVTMKTSELILRVKSMKHVRARYHDFCSQLLREARSQGPIYWGKKIINAYDLKFKYEKSSTREYLRCINSLNSSN